MILDPSKLILSSFISVLILVVGGLAIASNNQTPELRIRGLAVANSSGYETVDQNSQDINVPTTEDSGNSYEQNSQEYANIDVETVAVSIESSTLSNSDDWSLENISDHTLEITR